MLALIDDELKRNLLLKSIAKKFNLREKLLESELDKILKQQVKQDSVRQVRKDGFPNKEKTILNFATLDSESDIHYLLEKELVKLLFEGNKEVIELIFKHMSTDDFQNKHHSELVNEVYEAYQNSDDLSSSALIARIKDEELQSYLLEITFDKYSISKTWDDLNPVFEDEKLFYKFALDTIKNFKITEIEENISKNNERMEQADDEDEKLKIMKENIELEKQKKSLKENIGL
jgi:hypothetical protein